MTYQSCLATCCDDCGLKVYGEDGLPSERDIADTALAHAVRVSDVQAMQGGPGGWFNPKQRERAERKERQRVSRQVMRETRETYGVGIISILLGSLLSGLISKVVSMIIDWWFNRASNDGGFGSAVSMMKTEVG